MECKNIKVYDSQAETVLRGIYLADVMNLSDLDISSKPDVNLESLNLKELTVSDVLACSYCNVSFTDNIEQRSHYKLDWHRYNLKRALHGNEPLSEDIFHSVAGDISSLSGSDTESSSNNSDCDLDDSNEQVKASEPTNFNRNLQSVRHTKVFFENEANEIFSLHRCLLQGKKETLSKEDLVNNACNLIKQPKKWLIVMLGGGHYAAGIFEDGNVIHHKTFHSYTVRSKQGGSQSTRDNRGGTHAKSAGASLRRYNEQTLIQHVQEIMSAWSEPIKQCSLILYRATGPWNRSVLFGGKSPPLLKTDRRLRNIPFPTKRATFKELKRVHDVLSNLQIYGSGDAFKTKFPTSPDKGNWSPKNKMEPVAAIEEAKRSPPKCVKRIKNLPKQSSSNDKIVEVSTSEESSNGDDGEVDLVWNDCVVNFDELQEFDDDVPQAVKDARKRNKKVNNRQKAREKEWEQTFNRTQRKLVDCCRNKNKDSFIETLQVYNDLPDRCSQEIKQSKKTSHIFTKEDFIDCLNSAVDEEDENTVLHVAALEKLPEFVTLLLDAGADPTVRNKQKQTPYVVADDKKTKISFRTYVATFPDKYDLKKANIPPPPTPEMEKRREEKKKEKRKLKQMRDKVKKQENKQKREENKEKEKFLALSDREKCALAAERRLLTSLTANVKSAKIPVLSRCFQCGLDITGQVPFEYGTNRFCSMPCLKAHRAKTKTYGHEI